jgi:hypothetical protein
LKLIALIEAPAGIEKILAHIRLDPQPPPRAEARRVDVFGVKKSEPTLETAGLADG